MKFLRWILFLPVGVLLISLGQIAASALALKLPGMMLGIVLLFAGWLWIGIAAAPVMISPSRRIGGSILAGVFIILELLALTMGALDLTGNEWAARIWTDLNMLLGLVVAAFVPSDKAIGPKNTSGVSNRDI